MDIYHMPKMFCAYLCRLLLTAKSMDYF